MTVEGVLLFIGGTTLLALSIYVGFKAIDYVFTKGVITTKNAAQLLTLQKPDEWNAFRTLNPDWQPILITRIFDNLSLTAINLQGAKLNGSSFRGAKLDHADFSGASLEEVNFSGASLRHANFDSAHLKGSVFEGAITDGASFKGTSIQEATTPPKIYRTTDISPTEDINTLLISLSERPELLTEIDARQFERLVARVMELLGYEVALTSGANDQGIDIIASRRDPVGESIYIVECKSYGGERLVGVQTVRAFYSIKNSVKADRAILVTDSRFTSEARSFATTNRDLELIDSKQLFEWIKRVT